MVRGTGDSERDTQSGVENLLVTGSARLAGCPMGTIRRRLIAAVKQSITALANELRGLATQSPSQRPVHPHDPKLPVVHRDEVFDGVEGGRPSAKDRAERRSLQPGWVRLHAESSNPFPLFSASSFLAHFARSHPGCRPRGSRPPPWHLRHQILGAKAGPARCEAKPPAAALQGYSSFTAVTLAQGHPNLRAGNRSGRGWRSAEHPPSDRS